MKDLDGDNNTRHRLRYLKIGANLAEVKCRLKKADYNIITHGMLLKTIIAIAYYGDQDQTTKKLPYSLRITLFVMEFNAILTSEMHDASMCFLVLSHHYRQNISFKS